MDEALLLLIGLLRADVREPGSVIIIDYRDNRHFVPVQLYAAIGGSISRYRRFSRLGG